MEARARRMVALGLVANGIVAALRSRQSRFPGRPFGLRWPFGPTSESIVWGTAIAPPLAMQALILGLAVRPVDDASDRMLRVLGATIFFGQLMEPIVYRLDDEDALTRLAVVANFTLAGYLGAMNQVGRGPASRRGSR